MNFHIRQDKLTDEIKKKIFDGFAQQAIESTGINGLSEDPLSFEIFDGTDFVGAIVVQIFWEQLHVKYLFVEKKYRGQGVARQLMNQAVEFGKKRGCHFAFVETMSFQALEFYEKLGFTNEFSRAGYAKNTTFHYLKKNLTPSNERENSRHDSIHRLSPDEAEKACREIAMNLPEYFGIPEANERYAKGVRERFTFGVKVKGVYVGIISCEMSFPNNANIYWMAVKKESHRQGFGSALLEHAEGFCRDRGCTSLTVETLSPNEKDVNYFKTYEFYCQRGFQPLFELNTHGPDFKMVYLYKLLEKDG